METTVSDICVFMNEYASLTYAEKWDNPGLLLGHVEAPVHKIMVALDLMPEVAEQAIEEEVDLIITHHPYYFHLPSSLAVTDTKMEVMYELIKHDIAVYAVASECCNSVFGTCRYENVIIGYISLAITVVQLYGTDRSGKKWILKCLVKQFKTGINWFVLCDCIHL